MRILSKKTCDYMTANHLPLGTGGMHRVDIDTIATDSGFSETAFDGIGFGLGGLVLALFQMGYHVRFSAKFGGV